MKTRLTTPLLVALVLVSTTANAQVAPPSCSAPPQPRVLETVEQINAWSKRIEVYQGCLDTYIQQQKQLSDTHAKAANDARDTWNQFVKKLNAANAKKKS
jgi:hypothetical protein